MQAIGLIETMGLVVAIEGADAMLKAAQVSLLDKNYVGGGLVTITITGDVGAVKAAVEAGVGAIQQINPQQLISHHVIPRPHESLEEILPPVTSQPGAVVEAVEVGETTEERETEPTVESLETAEQEASEVSAPVAIEIAPPHSRGQVEEILRVHGLEKTMAALEKLTVVKLRNLAREYKDFPISGRRISKADKKLLMTEFRKQLEKTF